MNEDMKFCGLCGSIIRHGHCLKCGLREDAVVPHVLDEYVLRPIGPAVDAPPDDAPPDDAPPLSTDEESMLVEVDDGIYLVPDSPEEREAWSQDTRDAVQAWLNAKLDAEIAYSIRQKQKHSRRFGRSRKLKRTAAAISRFLADMVGGSQYRDCIASEVDAHNAKYGGKRRKRRKRRRSNRRGNR